MRAELITDNTILDEEIAWQAVLSKDPVMNGRFVYAVRTTGVFCRPGCASRRPNRRNVTFFATPQEAESAGFRACKRCAPTGAEKNSAEEYVQRMQAYIDQHQDERPTLEAIARHVGLSQWHAQRIFKRGTGLSPREYLAVKQTEQLKVGLRKSDTVSRAIYDAGFNSSSVVYESAAERLGMTPATYKRGGLGVTIEFTIVSTPIGNILIAATDRGICSVTMGDDAAALESDLRDEFPRATIDRAHAGFDEWTAAVSDYIEGRATRLDLPLDVGGTPFQKRVWQALRQIPYGATRTYSEIATALQAPRAVRAVANACANNRVALAIPCHRVIRSDGQLGGYKWGLERKARILQTEAARATQG